MHPVPVTLGRTLEGLEFLDGPAERVQRVVAGILPGGALKDALGGTRLGHPLHPLLTDAVLGAWLGALVLDLAGGERSRDAADLLAAAGIAAAVPTAASGLSDWADTRGPARRVGAVHALGNVAALTLWTASLAARRSGARTAGVLLGLVGNGIAGGSGWLGGHLSYGLGVGVSETAHARPPADWTAAAGEGELGEGALLARAVGGVDVLIAVREGRVLALLDRCTHRGCSLAAGELADGTVVCPCHGSAFRLEDGTVERGPATEPQQPLDTRLRDGAVEVRATAPGLAPERCALP